MEHEHKWDLVDAVSRSPLLQPPRVRPGIDLAAVEQRLLAADELSVAERERLVASVRELADVLARIKPGDAMPLGEATRFRGVALPARRWRAPFAEGSATVRMISGGGCSVPARGLGNPPMLQECLRNRQAPAAPH